MDGSRGKKGRGKNGGNVRKIAQNRRTLQRECKTGGWSSKLPPIPKVETTHQRNRGGVCVKDRHHERTKKERNRL